MENWFERNIGLWAAIVIVPMGGLVAFIVIDHFIVSEAEIGRYNTTRLQIFAEKDAAINNYMSERGLRFEGDEGYEIKERLDIVQIDGRITTTERVRIDADLNQFVRDADTKLDVIWNEVWDKVHPIVMLTKFFAVVVPMILLFILPPALAPVPRGTVAK